MHAGEVFAGYLIERRLGSGGMGEVFLARHPRLPRLIALKVLSPEFASENEIRMRFEREAELIARLDHPNIVSVSDRGVENGRLWIAMQYIDGGDASELTPSTLPPQNAVGIVAETAKALDYAHAVGILHRDVKPANIMLARPTLGHGERVLLTDFGIGRLRDDTAHLTRTGTLTATLAYASPEQLSGIELDERSDQYSLACSLYWLLCGATPFQSGTAAAVVAGHLHFAPPPVSSRRPGLPASLDAVLARALAKNPADRFDSCRDFAAAATRALTGTDPTLVASPPIDLTLPPTFIAQEPVTPAQAAASPTSDPAAQQTPPGSPWSDPASQWSVPVSPWSNPAVPQADIPPPGPQSDPGVPVANGYGAPPPVPPRPHISMPGPRKRRGRWVAIGAAAVAVVLAVTVGIVWATRDSGSSGGAASKASPVSAGPSGLAITPGGGIQPLMRVDAQGSNVSPLGAALDPAGDGTAKCKPVSIAMAGALTGANAVLGRNVIGGARLAVDQFTRKNPGCAVTLKQFDTTGDPQLAAKIAPQITADDSVVALIGPVFSGETRATGQTLDDAGLPFLTPSASNSTLSKNGWRSFFRGLATDDFGALAMGRYLAGTGGFHGVCVVWDNTDYGLGLGKAVTTGLGSAADQNCSIAIDPRADFGPTVAKIAAAGPDAIFYAGYYTESGPLLKALRQAAVTVPFFSGDGSNDRGFLERAGAAAAGATLFCLCGPTTARIASDYKTLNGEAPGVYSIEAYDLTAILLHAIASGHTDRRDLAAYLHTYSGTGTADTYRWTDTGELTDPHLWLYQVG